jgi:hypothetical protein
LAIRAAVWKTTPQPRLVGLPVLIGCTLVSIVADLASQYVEAGTAARFTPYGLNASLAVILMSFMVAALFVRPQGRATVISALVVLGTLFSLGKIALLLSQGQESNVSLLLNGVDVATFAAAMLILLAIFVWWLGATVVVLRSVEPERPHAFWRACALWFTLFIIVAALPHYPTFRGHDFYIQTANLWEYVSAYRDGRLNFHKEPPPRYVKGDDVDLSQASLLDAQISHLSKQVKGKTDIYAIGIAGSSEQDVFLKELKGGLASLAHVFPLEGHVVELVNHPDTVRSLPIASRQNFSAVVRAMARVMDRNEDVLLLFMTSHGSGGGVALSLPGAVYEGLSPANVATVLDREGIKNRVVIVSACYSGVFLKPLANENTIILTAADEDNTSFGCSNERDWTYFGDAFFNQGLHHGGTIEQAFLDAKVSIAQWEARDRLTPSNPQGHFGAALMKKLAPVYQNAKNAMISGAASPR